MAAAHSGKMLGEDVGRGGGMIKGGTLKALTLSVRTLV